MSNTSSTPSSNNYRPRPSDNGKNSQTPTTPTTPGAKAVQPSPTEYERVAGGIARKKPAGYQPPDATTNDSDEQSNVDSDEDHNGGDSAGAGNNDEGDKKDRDNKQAAKVQRPRLTQPKPPPASQTASSSAPSKKKIGTGSHREPTPKMCEYSSSKYTLYNLDNPQLLPNKVAEAFRSFDQYNDYLLYSSPNVKSFEEMPKQGVRVDDLTIMKLYEWGIKSGTLNDSFPADFDKQGMVRATRVPLGNAAKVWKEKGDKDIDDREIKKSGWYSIWNKAGLTGTKRSSWASTQAPPGEAPATQTDKDEGEDDGNDDGNDDGKCGAKDDGKGGAKRGSKGGMKRGGSKKSGGKGGGGEKTGGAEGRSKKAAKKVAKKAVK
ncbi:hypothetical protein G7Y79_00011g030850 [Physcia stellaris]|nr:hypothetical protein G7Y79_00011g030850 [Physcia stellaris]